MHLLMMQTLILYESKTFFSITLYICCPRIHFVCNLPYVIRTNHLFPQAEEISQIIPPPSANKWPFPNTAGTLWYVIGSLHERKHITSRHTEHRTRVFTYTLERHLSNQRTLYVSQGSQGRKYERMKIK